MRELASGAIQKLGAGEGTIPLKLGYDQKPLKVYDRDGLFLLANPGRSMLWRWPYRFDGKEKLMELGEYPLVNLGQDRPRTPLRSPEDTGYRH